MRVNASRHEYLIAVSPTLLPISLISSVLRIMHGQLLRILPVGGEREMVLSGIRIIDWQTVAHNNFYLDRCMKYREKYKEYTDSVSDLIELHRNLDGHLYDIGKALVNGGSELIQYAHCPLLLTECVEALWMHGSLGSVCLEDLFIDGTAGLLKLLPKQGARPPV
jgi:hypothetical protein